MDRDGAVQAFFKQQDHVFFLMDAISGYVRRQQEAPAELWGRYRAAREELEALRDAAGLRRD